MDHENVYCESVSTNPTLLLANGMSNASIKLWLKLKPKRTPAGGKKLSFQITTSGVDGGSLGRLSSNNAVTNSNGLASVQYIAPRPEQLGPGVTSKRVTIRINHPGGTSYARIRLKASTPPSPPPEPPITPDPVVKPPPEGESLPPWVPAAAGAAAGTAAATGALLMMAASGVKPKEVWDGIKNLMSQGTTLEEPPSEEQSAYDEAWEQFKEERAPYKPKAGDLNEKGEIYDEAVDRWVEQEDHEILTGEKTPKRSYAEDDEIQKAFDQVSEEKRKLEEIRRQRRDTDAYWKEQDRLEAERAKAQAPKPGFVSGVLNRVTSGVSGIASEVWQAGKDVYNDPLGLLTATGKNIGRELLETGQDAVELGKKGLSALGGAALDVARDPTILVNTLTGSGNDIAYGLKTSAKGVAQAANDIYDDPSIIGKTLTGMGHTIASGAEAVKDAVTDPDKVVNAVKMLSGIENFENSLDPNRSLPHRVGQVGLGVLNMYGSITGAEWAAQGVTKGTTNLMGHIASGAGNLADDATRLAAGSVDDTARLAAGSVDDAGRAAGGRTRPTDEYAKFLKERNTSSKHSTVRPGEMSDFVANDIIPDTSGYAKVSEKHIQVVADNNGVTIHTRPTSTYAKKLLVEGKALPKPELIKNKSISEIDLLIGAKTDDLGKVGHFKPSMPKQGRMSDELYGKVGKRYKERFDEFKDQSPCISKHSDKVRVEGNLVVDAKTGLPFTGDVDGFAIRGKYNETLPKAVVERVEKELIQGPGHVKHGVHTEWDYSEDFIKHVIGLPDGRKSKFEIKLGIDQNIRLKHAPGGESLVTYSPKEGMGAPNPKASWWKGGTDNPLVN